MKVAYTLYVPNMLPARTADDFLRRELRGHHVTDISFERFSVKIDYIKLTPDEINAERMSLHSIPINA